ncbi:MAG: hypothetical protein VXY90_13875, partial [Pseudomonadota bacterium]|nr:hypothetical protein [Pseudomonadota bacterium]MEC8585879.1 hypothetical protein [Pseudomonadota bacterium]
KATGRPVKLVWSREEEFAMDAVRPLSATRFRGAVGPDGCVYAIPSRGIGGGMTPNTPNKRQADAHCAK